MLRSVESRRSLAFAVVVLAIVGAVAPHAAGQVTGAHAALDGSPSVPQAPPAEVPAEVPEVQLAQPESAGQAPPMTLTLKDALERARKNDAAYLATATNARLAHEDRIQARAALLPAVTTTTQELLTKGGSILPTGRFVTNDGVHVYRAWGVLHEDLSPNLFTLNGYKRAAAAEALAQAQQEIATRGLTVTVTQYYYGLLVAQRKYATAQQSRDQARQFYNLTQDLEKGGQAAHADVIKAEIQLEQQQQALEDSRLAMEQARLSLAVLLSPALDENFTAVDDLDQAPALPSFPEVRDMAAHSNPDLKAAVEALRVASADVSAARQSFMPMLSIDADYGIEANEFALRGGVSGVTTPEERALQQNNLGEFITFNLTFPVWDWGNLRSRLHQSEFRRQQARVDLTYAQRKLVQNLYSSYNEAQVAFAAVDRLRHSAELAGESLRLTNLRYKAGDATVLEVLDAQNTLALTRNAYDDGEARYRLALANLQTLTGTF
ncbi:MAG TPA: TolC family protein [Terriglobia bacterium]|nr:TolC family protein [Terriglobia bacterium]